MNVLFSAPYGPNLIRVRPYNLIRELTLLGHRVTVATVWTDESESRDVENLKEHCEQVLAEPISRGRSAWNCLQALPTRVPLQAVYSWLPSLERRVQELIASPNGRQPFDVIHVEHLRGARYGGGARSAMAGSQAIPIVWDSVDCISYLFRQASEQSGKLLSRLITRFELGRTEEYEAWLLGQFDRVLVTSEIDRKALSALEAPDGNGSAISVLPNGVDLEYFKPDPGLEREPATVVMTGKMSYHANVSMCLYFAREVLPLVHRSRPDVKLMVVGKDPAREVRELAAHPMIEVTGTVEDLRPYLRRATVAVAPVTYGAGIQNKVLEAMACGAPVVSSPQAVSALDLRVGEEALVADKPEAFAASILSLIEDPRRRLHIGEAGRRYVARHHAWSAIARHLEEDYSAAIGV